MTGLPHPVTGRLFDSPVAPGVGWPGDPATAHTQIAISAVEVESKATDCGELRALDAAVTVCCACPRLVEWRELVAATKRRSFAGEPYWGRPIAGWGAAQPKVLVVGLAPAAHGGNRTGRIFTGDRSGDWLFAALHRVGLATQPTSVHAGDGLSLIDTRMLAVVRCAPPDNKPTPVERDTCAGWLDAELAFVLPSTQAVVCLGAFAWDAMWRALGRQGLELPKPRTGFGHGSRADLTGLGGTSLVMLGCYHPSQQNTFTGKLTEPMLDAVLGEAAALAGRPAPA